MPSDHRDLRCPLCLEILLLEDDDCVVNACGLAFCTECWSSLSRTALAAGIDPDDIEEAVVQANLDDIQLKVRRKPYV